MMPVNFTGRYEAQAFTSNRITPVSSSMLTRRNPAFSIKHKWLHCLSFTINAWFHIPISGIHMQKPSPRGVIGPSQKAAVKQVILND